ncbi:hypothetical protein [Chitinasiproducens palmae]|uniref:Uncharacterized protein n=1 Tax=Chitinasiproducens palmae TaxID=1770053 RepID=A0A1H2PPI0_9BURK|nr:hypothetical protein [Chitinasiproducens palmae]SDV48672.1 hypothetical protein SAMN05216551_105286 [Chitinasiproducens palmae]
MQPDTSTRRIRCVLPLFGLMLVAAAQAAEPLPRDVQSLVSRRDQCEHWAGEEPYDRARARQITAAMQQLRCERVDNEIQRLRGRYASQPAVVRALADPAE